MSHKSEIINLVMGTVTPESIINDLRYLQLLSRSFPTITDASTEIINLEVILNLPKGTEHFLTDIHGEYETFQHILKNASGAVKKKVNEIFGHALRKSEEKEICALIYYPEEKLQLIKEEETDLDDWYLITLSQLVKVCWDVSSKYTRSKVRKVLPAEFSYIIQELLHESSVEPNKHAYINVIVSTIISTKRADDFITAMCELVQRLTIDSLHIVGDIHNHDSGAYIVMGTLCDYHNFDIQWGSHDILWMGAISSGDTYMTNVIRISMCYANLATLEGGYGINLLPLVIFAMDTYAGGSCAIFAPKMNLADASYDEKTLYLIAQMYKATTIIQFKLEAEIISRRPEFGMENRRLLHKIDFERGMFVYEGEEHELRDANFPTIDPVDPYHLTDEERELVDKVHTSFMNSEKLKRHMRCLFTCDGVYLVCNSNLLYHASVPLSEGGSFKHVRIGKKEYQGHKLLQKTNQLTRTARFDEDGSEEKNFALDYMWHIWCGPDALSFGKDKMATFGRHFVTDKILRRKSKGRYYTLHNRADVRDGISTKLGMEPGPHSHIIDGHVPVKTIKGERPAEADGKLLMIDGGFSKAYQPRTGIAGYTLVYRSYGMQLMQHDPFQSRQKAIEEGQDIKSTTFVIEFNSQRVMVKDTDKDKQPVTQIQDLKKLLVTYRTSLIKEKEIL